MNKIHYITITLHCKKKLACLTFDFGVVNTMEDNCEQQVPSVAVHLRQWQLRWQDDGHAWFTTAVVWLKSTRMPY